MRSTMPAVALWLCVAGPAAADPLVPGEPPAFNGWIRGVQMQIIGSAMKATGFPRSAHVTVAMTLEPDGSVEDVHALPSSDPDPRFRALGEHVVELARPFPPMPPGSGHSDGVVIRVPLSFKLLSPPPSKRKTAPKHRA